MLLVTSTTLIAQTQTRKVRFPIWTYHQKNVTIDGLSVGIGSFDSYDGPSNVYTNGLKFELVGLGILLPLAPKSPVVETDSAYVKLSREPLSEKTNGISLAGAGTVCDCTVNGINIGAIGHATRTVNGISIAAMINLSQKLNGIQVSAFNESFNLSGLQIGLANNAARATGMQIGAYNTAKKLKGIQIGLWNVNEKRKLPLVNWNFSND